VATDDGATAVVPVLVAESAVGRLELRRAAPAPFDGDALELARILADVAAALVAVDRQRDEHRTLVAQLQHALDSRVVIEQAKGVLAARLGLPLHEAFELLRDRAREANQRLADVAQRVVASQSDEEPTVRHRSRRGPDEPR
jgi:GAF domain-containing protein